MEIKGPIVPPQLHEITIDQDQQQKQTSKSSETTTSTTDVVEVSKTNSLAEQLNAAQQNDGNAGDQHLDSEQQKLADNFHPQDFTGRSFFTGDSKSKTDDRKNSGLQLPFTVNDSVTNPESEKVEHFTDAGRSNFLSPNTKDQTSDAVKDADRLASEGLRKAFQDEMSDKNSGLTELVGSQADRLQGLLDPGASGPQSDKSVGKDGLAYETHSSQKNPDGSTTNVTDKTFQDDKGMHVVHSEETNKSWSNLDGVLWDAAEIVLPFTQVESHTIQTDYLNDNTKVVTETTVTFEHGLTDDKKTTTTNTTTTEGDGTVKTKNETKTEHKDGTTNTTTTETTTPAGGAKSYDPENYHGDIPAQIQRLTNFIKQQMQNLKQDPGGETVHTTGENEVSGPTYNPVAKQGSAGLFGQPNQVGDGVRGGSGAGNSQFMEHADFGPDSDAQWTGPTHDQKVGVDAPKAPIEGTPDSSSTKTDDTSGESEAERLWEALRRLEGKE